MAFFGPPPPFVGATTSAAGVSGLVPAPEANSSNKFLANNGLFKEAIPFPQYKNTSSIVGAFSSGHGSALTSGNGTPTLNTRTFNWIFLPVDGNIDRLLFRTGTNAPSPAYNIHIALWKAGEDGTPSDYIIGGNQSTGTNANTDITVTVASTPIKSGLYYLSTTPDSSGTANSLTIFSATSQNFIRRSIGVSDLGNTTANNFSYVCGTSYNQTTHEQFIASVTQVLSVGIRYA